MKRQFLESLLYEQDGDLNISQFLLAILVLCGAFSFLYETITGARASIASWSFLGASVSALLIGALPIAKAKILANSKLPGSIAEGISMASDNVERTTDLSEKEKG